MKLNLAADELRALQFGNERLLPDVRLSEGDMEDLAAGKVTLGLLARAKRALTFLEIPLDEQPSGYVMGQLLPREIMQFATRAEQVVLEDTVENTGLMMLGIFEALRAKGILTQEDLNAALKRVADGRVVEVSDA